MNRSPFTAAQIALALAFLSFTLAALTSRIVFERLPHLEDEMAYIFQARIFARGDVVIETPQPRRAYWQPFVVDEAGNRFGKYTPGWPALLALGVLAGQMWIVNALLAALTVALTYRLGRDIFGAEVGLIAAALVTFSPMALLLNATLMGHTAALFAFTLFMAAYWRTEQGRHTLRWAALAGIALGLLVVNRPLTAAGVVLPFIGWSGLRVMSAAWGGFSTGRTLRNTWPVLRPLLALALIALGISAAIPAFNHAATGDARKNLYTLVWAYDRVGFGSCCGRSSLDNGEGHTIIKGVRHARFDLSLTAADLFGWQIGRVTPALQDHLRGNSDYWPRFGLSWVLIPFGLFIGLRRRWLRAWMIALGVWLAVPPLFDMAFLLTDQNAVWLWLAVAWAIFMIPPIALAFRRARDARVVWTWLLLAAAVSLVSVHLAYWIGSQRYSTRYYFEALVPLALLSALPVAWLAKRLDRQVVYTAFGILLILSLLAYSAPRINALYRFNGISPEQVDGVNARRSGDRPVLVIVTGPQGDVRWRAHGSLMAVTGPYLDDDIVVAWDYAPGATVRQQIIARFPDREIIEMAASGDRAWFLDDP